MKTYQLLLVFSFLSILIVSCSKEKLDNDEPNPTDEICDCAKMVRPKNINEISEFKAAKRCLLKYGGYSDYEKMLLHEATSVYELTTYLDLYKIEEKLNIECNKKRDYSQEQLDLACDCWHNSFKYSKMPYDNMTSSQQKLRNKCFDIFGDEEVMEYLCENSK